MVMISFGRVESLWWRCFGEKKAGTCSIKSLGHPSPPHSFLKRAPWAKGKTLVFICNRVIWRWCPQKYCSEAAKQIIKLILASATARATLNLKHWRKYQKLNWEKSIWLRVDKSNLTSRPRNGFSSLAAAARWRGGDGCSFPVAPKVSARWNLTKMGGAWGLPIAFSVVARILDQTTAEK